jgi:hypothetical protein
MSLWIGLKEVKLVNMVKTKSYLILMLFTSLDGSSKGLHSWEETGSSRLLRPAPSQSWGYVRYYISTRGAIIHSNERDVNNNGEAST